MNLFVTEQAEGDIAYWNKTDKAKSEKILELIANAMETPFSGLGKPEPLRYDMQGCWSRRIDREHRLVYMVEGDSLTILACRYHYK